MTIPEVAAELGVHRATVHGYVARGLIKALKLNRRMWLVEPAEVQRFKAEGRRPHMGRPSGAKDKQPRPRRSPPEDRP